jgi:hypothetical protein
VATPILVQAQATLCRAAGAILLLGQAQATLIPAAEVATPILGVAAVTLILEVVAATLIPGAGAIIQAQAGAQVARNLETTFQADTREFVSIKHSEIS